jgi:hypothetical protein
MHGALFLSLLKISLTDRAGWPSRHDLGSFSGGAQFESKLSRLMIFVVALSPFRQMEGILPRLDDERFFPKSFLFIIR